MFYTSCSHLSNRAASANRPARVAFLSSSWKTLYPPRCYYAGRGTKEKQKIDIVIVSIATARSEDLPPSGWSSVCLVRFCRSTIYLTPAAPARLPTATAGPGSTPPFTVLAVDTDHVTARPVCSLTVGNFSCGARNLGIDVVIFTLGKVMLTFSAKSRVENSGRSKEKVSSGGGNRSRSDHNSSDSSSNKASSSEMSGDTSDEKTKETPAQVKTETWFATIE